MKKLLLLLSLVLTVAGCGIQQPTTLTLNKSTIHTQENELKFTPVTIAELTASTEKTIKRGKLVTFEGSFDREQWSISYGSTHHGYQLWDKNGHRIRVYNIYTVKSLETPVDDFRDFNQQAIANLLTYGHYVKIEGEYIPGEFKSSHGGAFYLEPSINIYFIDGTPVQNYIEK